MAKGDYYFKLFYKRLIASTIGWKDDEFGAYVRLLIHQFDNDNRIPDDLDELSRIAPSVKKNWKLVGKKFKKDDAGMLYNEVMSDEFNDVQDKKRTNKTNALIAVEKRRHKQTINQTVTDRSTDGAAILITNNQEPITNKEVLTNSELKTVVGANGSNIPPPASTTTDFVNERQEKIYEMFNRVTTWKPEVIMLEVSRFMNKYPTVPLNQCGPLINSWAANYKPILQTNSVPGGTTIADEIYQARKKEGANGYR